MAVIILLQKARGGLSHETEQAFRAKDQMEVLNVKRAIVEIKTQEFICTAE